MLANDAVNLPPLPSPYVVGSTIKCTACGAPYSPPLTLAGGAAQWAPGRIPPHACRCGNTQFGGTVSSEALSPAQFTADQMRAYCLADRATRAVVAPAESTEASDVGELIRAAQNARDHFYEFSDSPESLAASDFGTAMDWLDRALLGVPHASTLAPPTSVPALAATPVVAPEAGRAATSMTKWQHTTEPLHVRRLGKTGEELAELAAVVSRCLIQGIDEIDPSSGKTNRQRFIDETADVRAQLNCNDRAFGLPVAEIAARVAKKEAWMAEWESHYSAAPQPTPLAAEQRGIHDFASQPSVEKSLIDLVADQQSRRAPQAAEASQQPPYPTHQEIHAHFKLHHGGPNPYYACVHCEEVEPGLEEYLVKHMRKCGYGSGIAALPTTLKADASKDPQ